jgi:hypothetical protein
MKATTLTLLWLALLLGDAPAAPNLVLQANVQPITAPEHDTGIISTYDRSLSRSLRGFDADSHIGGYASVSLLETRPGKFSPRFSLHAAGRAKYSGYEHSFTGACQVIQRLVVMPSDAALMGQEGTLQLLFRGGRKVRSVPRG